MPALPESDPARRARIRAHMKRIKRISRAFIEAEVKQIIVGKYPRKSSEGC